MAFYDIVMLVVVVAAVWFGWWKGLAWQIASVAAIIVSYIVAVNFREPVSQYISADEPWNRIGAMLILFLGTSLVIWTIYASISKSLKKMELKGFDHQAGALSGAVKGALLCMIITMFSVSLLGEKAHDAIHNSRSGRYVVTGITKVSAIVPGELAKYIQPHVDNFNNAIGHDGQLPIGQYPENPPFNFNFNSNQQTAQDPNQVPSYSANLSKRILDSGKYPAIRSIPIRVPPPMATRESTSAGHSTAKRPDIHKPPCQAMVALRRILVTQTEASTTVGRTLTFKSTLKSCWTPAKKPRWMRLNGRSKRIKTANFDPAKKTNDPSVTPSFMASGASASAAIRCATDSVSRPKKLRATGKQKETKTNDRNLFGLGLAVAIESGWLLAGYCEAVESGLLIAANEISINPGETQGSNRT